MRLKPYTTIGIKRIACKRCGKPSRFQWNICSLGQQFHAICLECDIALNALVLEFFDIPNREQIIEEYRQSKTNVL